MLSPEDFLKANILFNWSILFLTEGLNLNDRINGLLIALSG